MATNNGVNSPLSGSTGTGNFVGSISPTIVTPKLDQINDANGNANIAIGATPSAVNYFATINNATGNPPALIVSGSDANIGMTIQAKGTGNISFNSASTTNPFVYNTGTGLQHATNFSFANTAQTRTITWPDASGTVSLSGQSAYLPAILDSNGNNILLFTTIASSVNYLQLLNASTGNSPSFLAAGTDTNVGINFAAKAAGPFIFQSTLSSQVMEFSTGTAYQHATFLSFANTSASRTVTFPDASGTLQLQSQPLITAPGNSASASLVLGTSFQNTTGSDILLTVYLSITAATTAAIQLGVGSATNPTQQTIVSSVTIAATIIVPVPIYIPNNYFALLSTSGTITDTIVGQIAVPI